MEKINDGPKTLSNDEKQKIKDPLESNGTSGNGKSAKNLGEGRWKYQGKIYKEEQIGRS